MTEIKPSERKRPIINATVSESFKALVDELAKQSKKSRSEVIEIMGMIGKEEFIKHYAPNFGKPPELQVSAPKKDENAQKTPSNEGSEDRFMRAFYRSALKGSDPGQGWSQGT